jgi:hypothetical protein
MNAPSSKTPSSTVFLNLKKTVLDVLECYALLALGKRSSTKPDPRWYSDV